MKLDDLLGALDAAAPDAGGAVPVVTVPAPAVPIERLLAAQLPGELLLWDPGHLHGEGAWAFSGRGVCTRLVAAGPRRVELLHDQAAELFGVVRERRDPACSLAPPACVFGGLAFEPGAASTPPWACFGDGSFVLPRWVYGRRGEQAFLRLALHREDIRERAAVGAELAAIAAALEGEGPSPATPEPASELEQMPPADWDELVRRALAAIRAGELEKVVVARRARLVLGSECDAIAALARLGRRYPECTRFALQRGEDVFLGASPEQLLALQGLDLRTEAFGGSSERRPAEDDARAGELLASLKDRREHAYVVDEIRAALGPVALEVSTPAMPRVQKLRDVQHLHTPLFARLRAPRHALELVGLLHPTPAVCGVPREDAAAWIRTHEPEPRGWYAGPVGWFDGQGDGVFAVAIRSAVVRGRVAWLYAGAGIVEGSDALLEYAETTVKQAAMLAAFGALER